ncbi:MAG: hypothetical protein GY720_10355 [bacterium]|nr:hypothetical protein [bacterium]
MVAVRGLLRRAKTEESGFTIIESVVAAGILVIAVLLTVTPLVTAMRALNRSKDVTVAESLAQGRIEQVRALEFGDIGHPGAAPAGILVPVETETVEGADYRIETTVQYVGSASGLNVVPQGGDGVEGAFDIGVNYKYVQVTVTPLESGANPVLMETFISPPTVGGLENIAVVQVDVDRHEPFDPSLDGEPLIQLFGSQNYTSVDANTTQYFADVAVGGYTISLLTSDGWLIHPETVASGSTSVTATAGVNALRTIRVYQPVSLDVVVLDDDTGLPITNAVVSATDQAYGPPITNAVGDYSFSGLVPDRYTVGAVASGYSSGSVEIDVPGVGGGTAATATIRLVPQAFVGVDYDFFVDYVGWNNYHINGATVSVTHSVHGTFVGTTDETGHVTIELPASSSGFTATASTPWGHGPASTVFNTGTAPGSRSLSVSKPGGTDRFALRNGGVGPDGFFEYKVGSGPWVRVPANDRGRVTFIVPEASGTVVQLATYCSASDYPASPEATASTTLNNSNKSWNAGTSC